MQGIYFAVLMVLLLIAKVKFTSWQRNQIRQTLLKDLRRLLETEKVEFEEDDSGFGLSSKSVRVDLFPAAEGEEDEFVFLDRRRGVPAIIRCLGSTITTVRLDAREVDMKAHPFAWDAKALIHFVREKRRILSQ